MTTVLLKNRAMTICSPPTLVQGWGGEQLGTSRYLPAHNCHILEIPVEMYNKFAETLMKGAHLPMRKWEPQFIEEPTPDAVREFWDGYKAGMDGHPENFSSMVGYFEMGFRSAFLEGNPDISKEVYRFPSPDSKPMPDAVREFWDGWNSGMDGGPLPAKTSIYFDNGAAFGASHEDSKYVAPEDEPELITAETHHKTLERIARDEGIDLSGIHGAANKAAAINAARATKLPA